MMNSSWSSSTLPLGGSSPPTGLSNEVPAVGGRYPPPLGGGTPAEHPDTKSLIILGVAVSNPARLSVFRSLGSAMVRQFDVIPTTMSLALIPVALRYSSSAACGWIVPIYVSLSV